MSEHPPVNIPSWMRWPPNCCETCVGWSRSQSDRWIGSCQKAESLDNGTATDARYRCPSFERRGN